jgi:alanyl-tRNA synthetase
VDPNSPLAPLKRAANSQKCIRAGGKHNDLDDVGKDTYHHTFFEMLGNWSFGDYFKAEAIAWAWELLTDVYGLDKSRLYATYFGGDAKTGLPADDEARQIWLQFLPADRVLPFGMKENFWEMGETGPCGPCSEIHYDRIGGRDASHLVNMDDPLVIEIWNNVFIQFNREADQSLRSLPSKHVDTGMGLERITSILQNKMSNYDTDLFQDLFAAIQQVTGAPAYTGRVGADDVDHKDTAYRVVADHIRTLSFAIADGCVPSNDGRGYVLRRVLRRGVRYGRQKLGAPKGFFTALVDALVAKMGGFFPELVSARATIADVIDDEEKQFNRTLDKGEALFAKAAAELKATGETMIPGATAFKLYDSFGFPIDLTIIMANELGMTVDVAGYQAEMSNARERSRQASKKNDAGRIVLVAEQTDALSKKGVATTDDSSKYVWEDIESEVVAIYDGKEFQTTFGNAEARVGVITKASNYYAESGGQIGDSGTISNAEGLLFTVEDTQSFGGYVVHLGTISTGSLKVGDRVTLAVDYERRKRSAANHSTTHMLNFALRKVLGSSVDQKGSLVDPVKLRFDFSHNGPVAAESLAQVESIVRSIIVEDVSVDAKVTPLKEAQRISALRAVFGETYPDPVRVVAVGAKVNDILAKADDDSWFAYSIEFCGGTHLTRSSQAQEFALIFEEGIAKGVRRVVGYTRDAAKDAYRAAAALMEEVVLLDKASMHADADESISSRYSSISQNVKAATLPIGERVKMDALLDAIGKRVKDAQKKNQEIKKKLLSDKAESLVASAESNKSAFVVADIPEATGDGKQLIVVAEALRKRLPSVAVLLTSLNKADKKVSVFAGVAQDESRISAKEWLSEAVKGVGGKGGGSNINAQGSATAEDVTSVLQAADKFAALKLQ